MDLFKLKNKKIFVLGGSGLLGSEICRVLSKQGAKVINLDLKKKKKLKNKEKYFKIDLSKFNLIEKELKKLFKKYGTPHCFVNCSYPADDNWKNSSFKDVTEKNIQQNVSLHLNSYIWVARIFAEQMRKKKIKGSIVQFGSLYGVVGQSTNIYRGTKMKENMIYSAIKGGIISNTRQMSTHYGRFGIRVNTICPGGVKGHVKNLNNKQPKKFLQNFQNRVPLKRLAKKEEISPAVAFLASDASSYITGITLMIDGGWSAS